MKYANMYTTTQLTVHMRIGDKKKQLPQMTLFFSVISVQTTSKLLAAPLRSFTGKSRD